MPKTSTGPPDAAKCFMTVRVVYLMDRIFPSVSGDQSRVHELKQHRLDGAAMDIAIFDGASLRGARLLARTSANGASLLLDRR
jgi:hypothetical protein